MAIAAIAKARRRSALVLEWSTLTPHHPHPCCGPCRPRSSMARPQEVEAQDARVERNVLVHVERRDVNVANARNRDSRRELRRPDNTRVPCADGRRKLHRFREKCAVYEASPSAIANRTSGGEDCPFSSEPQHTGDPSNLSARPRAVRSKIASIHVRLLGEVDDHDAKRNGDAPMIHDCHPSTSAAAERYIGLESSSLMRSTTWPRL